MVWFIPAALSGATAAGAGAAAAGTAAAGTGALAAGTAAAGATAATTALPAATAASNAPGLAGLSQQFQVPQGAAFESAGGGLKGAGGAVRSDFWPKFEASQGGPQSLDKVSDAQRGLEKFRENALDGLGDSASAFDGRLSNVVVPQRSTNRWQPNPNPGLAGLMDQMRASLRGGFGGRRR